MPDPYDPVTIFISYSHRDEDLRIELDKHLSGLKHRGLVSVWHDRRIGAGDEWAKEIDNNLNSSNVVLLLVSSDFMASKYCYDIEMNRAMERHDGGEAAVIPVILRPCDWEGSLFGKCQALPKNAKPITTWDNPDVAWLDVVRGIQTALEKIKHKSSIPSSSKTDRAKPNRRLLPYLCNRSDQEIELAKEVQLHQQERGARPLVLLIHGDELECHGEFIDRIETVTLPKLFKLDSIHKKVRRAQNTMRLPHSNPGTREYWASLGQALVGDIGAGEDEFKQYISQQNEPILIDLELLTSDYGGISSELINSFINFCATWEDLPPGRTVVLCISLKYERLTNVRFWDSKKKKLLKINEQLKKISFDQYSSSSKVSVVKIPELEPIPRGDVVAWTRSESVREICLLPDRDIRLLYENESLCDEKGRIPMETLAEELKKFIE